MSFSLGDLFRATPIGLVVSAAQGKNPIEEAEKGLKSTVQAGSDVLANGPGGLEMRQALEDKQQYLRNLQVQYQNQHSSLNAWREPLQNCGIQTGVIVAQSCDLLHGLAVNYKQIIDDADFNVADVAALSEVNLVEPLVDMNIPGTLGGIPTALIPGVESLKMVEGVVNMIDSSFSLGEQLQDTRDAIDDMQDYLDNLNAMGQAVRALKDYLLQTANAFIQVYTRTTGLDLEQFSADTAEGLAQTASDMEDMVARLENVKGNVFMTTRLLMNVSQRVKVNPGSQAHISFIADRLYQIDDIGRAFDNIYNVQTFVQRFFDGSLLAPAVMLHLPRPPAIVAEYVSFTAPTHKSYTDPTVAKQDPPPINLDDFPGQ